MALSPGTRLGNRFCGHSACIPRPSYQGKVNQISTNLRHFPLENIDSTAIFAVFPGKVNHFAANLRHFPAGNVDSSPEILLLTSFPELTLHFPRVFIEIAV